MQVQWSCLALLLTVIFCLCFSMIEFKNKDHAKKAIEKMHKFKIGEREIVVREVGKIVSLFSVFVFMYTCFVCWFYAA